ncbi:helix-turn-helix domain-containing protein [Roseovarius sp. B08]|uniref:helix-turn-helix domain-containing protein n=1 Tax=Roseovarius sp. B08 TaxID=3449223 RepID=UPI003EDBB79E
MESTLSPTPPLAQHLRDLRQSRNLTLADLAEASTVSRASLSRIENGEVSPTADTLAKLSTALRLPISQLISPLESRFQAFVARTAQPVYHDASHGFRRRNVSPPSADLQMELVEATLEPDAHISYDHPSVPGHEHHFVLLEGALQITVDGQTHSLSPGDCLRYRLNGVSEFRAGSDGARYLLALA